MKGTLTNQDFNTLLTVLKNNNYEVYEKPYELNIIGIRTDSFVPNSFNDWIIVFYKDNNNNWVVNKYSATTDPGTYWLKNPMASQGTAILKKGQYKNSYAVGSHRGQYTALVQISPVTVIRDYDRDNKLSYDSMRSTTGLYGINIHRAGSVGETGRVDKYSAGCQVFSDAGDFKEFIELAQKHKGLYGNKFTYTLLDERENAIRARSLADTFLPGEYRWYPGSTGLPIDIYFESDSPLIKAPEDKSTHCSGFTFSVFFVTALNRGLLNNFTDNDIKTLFQVWNESDGTKYPKLCVKAISQPIRAGLNPLGKEVSLEQARPGDFCQIWRTTGTAHNALIVEVLRDGNNIIGLKYYSSNPIANPETNKTGIGLAIEKFSDVGGTMLRPYTYFARLTEEVVTLSPLTVSSITQQNPEQLTSLETKGKKRN
jgi:hypothetical protein